MTLFPEGAFLAKSHPSAIKGEHLSKMKDCKCKKASQTQSALVEITPAELFSTLLALSKVNPLNPLRVVFATARQTEWNL